MQLWDDDKPPMRTIEGSVSASSVVVAPAPQPPDQPKNGLTDQQMAFVQAFVENGGKSGEAALTAGYGHDTYGVRLLAKPKVQAELVRRVKLQSGAALTIAMDRLIRIIQTSPDDKAAVSAAIALLDRFGLHVPKGPLVAMQVNNISGQAASSAISEVAKLIQERRQQRLGA